jgi:hypothetical protein
VAPAAGGRLPALRARLAAAGVAAEAGPAGAGRRALAAVLTAAPDAAIVRALGSASGWKSTPQGRAELAWAWAGAAAAFNVRLRVPGGVAGRLALPLALLRDAALRSPCRRARVAGAVGGGGEGGAPPRAVFDADVAVLPGAGAGAGDAAAAGCAPLGRVGGDRLALCSRAAPAPHVTASLAPAAAAEGAGRMHGGRAADWETGALLVTLPHGDFRVSSAPADCEV